VSIQPYRDTPESPTLRYLPYDPRAPRVAELVSALIRTRLPAVTVEHVGSTAVPGCAGKGVVDLMIAVAPEERTRVAEGLLALGFQPQSGGNPRPLMVEGAIELDGALFKLHVHVVPPDAEDTHAIRRLRDTLRAHPELRDEYVALKFTLIASGITDRIEYTRAKTDFIRRAIGHDPVQQPADQVTG
jgi:GrpB-like predicted nucleotidyltransferase (UPF0157 family)